MFFILILFLGVVANVKSQHCGWDNCHVIVLDVRDSLTGTIINDLDITLSDSSGKAYTSEWNRENYEDVAIYKGTDTLKFGQNRHNKARHQAYAISFGADRYMLLVYPNNYPGFNEQGTDRIVIKDPKGGYKGRSLTFDRHNIAQMCTNSAIWHDEKELERVTVRVSLTAKNK